MRFVIFLSWLFCFESLSAQSLKEFDAERIKHEKSAMTVLASWAGANLISGFALSNGENEHHYFWQMNGLWNTVNLSIAGVSYYFLTKATPVENGLDVLMHNIKSEKAFLFNTALDCSYIALGFYLRERAKNQPEERNRLNGFGSSLITQGGFLLVFDFINYTIASMRTQKIQSALSYLSVSPTGFSMRIPIK
jgi:hypothetical protein